MGFVHSRNGCTDANRDNGKVNKPLYKKPNPARIRLRDHRGSMGNLFELVKIQPLIGDYSKQLLQKYNKILERNVTIS